MERLRVVTHVFLDDEPRLPNRRAVREALLLLSQSVAAFAEEESHI
jgi:hypothetical protein